MELLGGDKLGRYEVIGRLAAGGMAEVYLARTLGHAGFAKTVALKRMLPQLAAEPGFRAMFMQEAAVAARLSHPHIVQIFDFAEERGELYLAMEFVHGVTLRQLGSDAQTPPSGAPRQPFPPVLAAHLCRCIARALSHAWQAPDEQGRPLHLIHRDVSPHNILLSYEGDPKLADFGIARPAERRTSVGQLKGKLLYMSPEQLRGALLDARSDVFALGIVLYETALALRRPLFDARTEDGVKEAILSRLIPPPERLDGDIPKTLAAVLLKALERNPERRFQSAAELADALGEVVHREARGPQDWDLAAYLRKVYGEPPPLPIPRACSARPPPLPSRQGPEEPASPGDDPRAETVASVKPGAGAAGASAREDRPGSKRAGRWRAGAVVLASLSIVGAAATFGGKWSDDTGMSASPGRPSDGASPIASPVGSGSSRLEGPARVDATRAPSPALASNPGASSSGASRSRPGSPEALPAVLPTPAVSSPPPAAAQPRPSRTQTAATAGSGSKRETGTLSVHLKPWGFVWLDGERFTGGREQEAAPLLRRRVSVGRHVVHLQDPEGRRRDLTVVVGADRESRIEGPFEALTARP